MLPDRLALRGADRDLERTLAVASARLAEQRADLSFSLARLDDRDLDRIGRSGSATAVADELAAVRGAALPTAADATSAEVGVRATGAERWRLVAWEPGGTERILAPLVAGTRQSLELTTTGAETGTVRRGVVVGQARARAGDDPALERGVMVDAERGARLVASLDGSKLGLLLRGRGDTFRIALGLLLGAGVLCAVATALVMDRALTRIADTAERMSGGDFEARLEVVGSDAGARVAASLNELAGALQERIGVLESTVDRLDRTLAAIDDGVCTWSRDGALETWNAAAAALTGTSLEAARAGAAVTAALREARVPGRRRALLPIGDGANHLVVDLAVRRTRDGGTLQVFRDAAPALSLEQARSNFLVTAAHELRTPLTTILGFAATLADDELPLTEVDRAVAIQHVLAESERLADVVQSLFDTSLLVRDRIEVSLERVRVADVVEHVVGASHAPMVELVGDVDATEVRADRSALERALAAVLDNAVKYGAPPIQLEVMAADDERIAIVVRDHGGGVPADHLDALFEPFNRLDPEMRSDVGGAGMGLYTARRLLGAMDATVVARCRPRRGRRRGCTEFVIELLAWRDEVRTAVPAPDGELAGAS